MDVREKLQCVASDSSYFCRKCGRKERGSLYIVPSQSVESIVGGMAHPVIWFCSQNFHHIRKLGWTKPVDFNIIRGKPENSDEEVPDMDASEEVWEEYVWELTQKEEAERKLLTV